MGGLGGEGDEGGDQAIDQLTASDSAPYFSDAGHRGGGHTYFSDAGHRGVLYLRCRSYRRQSYYPYLRTGHHASLILFKF